MSSSKTMNDLKKQFECAICSETFQKPKSLPCLHTFCEDCLDELLQTQKSKKLPLSCPYCKKEYPNISTVKDLPINFLIESTVEIVHSVADKKVVNEDANPSICCGSCREEYDEHNDAVKYCEDCQLPLCDGHVILHQKNKNTKGHTLVPVDQMSKKPAPISIKKPCPKHRGEKLKFLCQCDELICRDCAVIDHDGHKKTDIDTAANQERANLKQLIMQTQKDVNPVEKSLSEVIEMMQKIEKK
jgi:hypothetical protein